jgi:hypothetical protein
VNTGEPAPMNAILGTATAKQHAQPGRRRLSPSAWALRAGALQR